MLIIYLYKSKILECCALLAFIAIVVSLAHDVSPNTDADFDAPPEDTFDPNINENLNKTLHMTVPKMVKMFEEIALNTGKTADAVLPLASLLEIRDALIKSNATVTKEEQLLQTIASALPVIGSVLQVQQQTDEQVANMMERQDQLLTAQRNALVNQDDEVAAIKSILQQQQETQRQLTSLLQQQHNQLDDQQTTLNKVIVVLPVVLEMIERLSNLSLNQRSYWQDQLDEHFDILRNQSERQSQVAENIENSLKLQHMLAILRMLQQEDNENVPTTPSSQHPLIGLLDLLSASQGTGIRLVGGTNNREGRVEVQYRGEWGTVCDDGWDANDARVVCRQLGLPYRAAVNKAASPTFGVGSGQIWLDNVLCTGSESTLWACDHSGWGQHNCGHREDAGVICTDQDTSTSLTVRLSGGSHSREGRVEILHDGVWGTICDDSWSAIDAKVVCRQLGYSSIIAVAKTGAYFGPGSGTIWMDDVACTGLERSLEDCSHRGWGQEDCSHSEDAGTICADSTGASTSVTVRLVRGSNAREGRVEILHDGVWGTVCDDSWSTDDAKVVCRQLGYSSLNAMAKTDMEFGPGSGTIWLDDVGCTGSERSLEDCGHRGWGVEDCSHIEDAGVVCG